MTPVQSAQEYVDIKADSSKVICPACCHQFTAICLDDQEDRARLYVEIDCEKSSYEDALKDRVALASEIESLRAELAESKANYLGACQTVAKMHEAAVGEITGPIRGVVEDVADVRAECERLRALLICTRSSVALDLRMYGQFLDRKGSAANDCDTDEYARIEKLLNDIDAIDAARGKP